MDPALALPPIDLIRPVAQAGSGRTPAEIRRAAEAFEAAFIAAMLQPVFAGLSVEAPFGGGSGEEAFRSFMVEAMAKQTTRSGGVGLSGAVERELLRLQGLTESGPV